MMCGSKVSTRDSRCKIWNREGRLYSGIDVDFRKEVFVASLEIVRSYGKKKLKCAVFSAF